MLNALRSILIGSEQQQQEIPSKTPKLRGKLSQNGSTRFEVAEIQLISTSVKFQHQLIVESLDSRIFSQIDYSKNNLIWNSR